MARGYRYHGLVDGHDPALKVVCEGRLRRLYVRGVRLGTLDWVGVGRWCDGCHAIVDVNGRTIGTLETLRDDQGYPLDRHIRGQDPVEERLRLVEAQKRVKRGLGPNQAASHVAARLRARRGAHAEEH